MGAGLILLMILVGEVRLLNIYNGLGEADMDMHMGYSSGQASTELFKDYIHICTNLQRAWYILAVKYVVVIIHTFAVLKCEKGSVGFVTGQPRILLPGLPYRPQRIVAKRHVDNRSAKSDNAILVSRERWPLGASVLVL